MSQYESVKEAVEDVILWRDVQVIVSAAKFKVRQGWEIRNS